MAGRGLLVGNIGLGTAPLDNEVFVRGLEEGGARVGRPIWAQRVLRVDYCVDLGGRADWLHLFAGQTGLRAFLSHCVVLSD